MTVELWGELKNRDKHDNSPQKDGGYKQYETSLISIRASSLLELTLNSYNQILPTHKGTRETFPFLPLVYPFIFLARCEGLTNHPEPSLSSRPTNELTLNPSRSVNDSYRSELKQVPHGCVVQLALHQVSKNTETQWHGLLTTDKFIDNITALQKPGRLVRTCILLTVYGSLRIQCTWRGLIQHSYTK
jgi:hypothetical protein